jgi:hypothetical protein
VSSTPREDEWTWTRAIVTATLIVIVLVIVLGFIPSIFRYWWAQHSDQVAAFVKDKTGFEFKDRYSLVRVHDLITMGYQTTVFVIPLVLAYITGEKRRRRLGLRGSEGVKGYLPGK